MRKHIFSNYHKIPSTGVLPVDKQVKVQHFRTKSDFIKMCKFFSENGGVDADIYEDGDQIEMHLYFNFRRFAAFSKMWVQTLLSAGAVMEIPAEKSRPCEIEIVLYWN